LGLGKSGEIGCGKRKEPPGIAVALVCGGIGLAGEKVSDGPAVLLGSEGGGFLGLATGFLVGLALVFRREGVGLGLKLGIGESHQGAPVGLVAVEVTGGFKHLSHKVIVNECSDGVNALLGPVGNIRNGIAGPAGVGVCGDPRTGVGFDFVEVGLEGDLFGCECHSGMKLAKRWGDVNRILKREKKKITGKITGIFLRLGLF
jgi:hypothetical protein